MASEELEYAVSRIILALLLFRYSISIVFTNDWITSLGKTLVSKLQTNTDQ